MAKSNNDYVNEVMCDVTEFSPHGNTVDAVWRACDIIVKRDVEIERLTKHNRRLIRLLQEQIGPDAMPLREEDRSSER